MRKSLMTIVLFMLLFCLQPIEVNAQGEAVLDLSEDEKVLLQQIALAEAGSQGIGGMTFVMQTILNRVESEEFPNTIEEVIFEEGQFATTKNDLYKKYEVTANSQKALKLLDLLENRGQLYFEALSDETDTWHARNLVYIFEHEDHIFYK